MGRADPLLRIHALHAGAVMDGDIDGFINAYLKWISKKDTQ